MFLFVKVCTFKGIVLSTRKTLSQVILSLLLVSCHSFLCFFEDQISVLGIKHHLGRCCSVLTTSASHLLLLVYLARRWPCLRSAPWTPVLVSPTAPLRLHGGITDLPNSNNLVTVISAGNKQKQLRSSLSLSAWMHSLWKAFLPRQKFRISNWNLGHVSRNDQTPMFRNNIIMQRMN